MKEIIQLHMLALLAGFFLDLCFGDPEGFPHCIRLIGSSIACLTKKIRKRLPKTKQGEFIGGILLVLVILCFFGGGSYLLLKAAFWVHTYLYLALATFICYQMLAMKDLKKESMRVYEALGNKSRDLKEARSAVSRIVGRDTDSLDESGIIRATVETIAENTSDGVIAPLIYMAIGGPVFGILYKAVNTMDSMVGYKNEEFLYFGRCAAKLDDAVNFIPARAAAMGMLLASGIRGLSVKEAFRIYHRDRTCHASPNSAQTEAVMAGALQVQLAGDASYFGKIYKKPTIGDAGREIEREDIRRANQLLYMTTLVILLIIIVIAYYMIYAFMG